MEHRVSGKNSVCKEVVVKKEKKQKCAKYGIMDTFLNNKKKCTFTICNKQKYKSTE